MFTHTQTLVWGDISLWSHNLQQPCLFTVCIPQIPPCSLHAVLWRRVGTQYVWEGEALSFFRARLEEVGSELALFHGTMAEISVNSEMRKMG